MTKEKAVKNLVDFTKILDDLDVPFILDGGTLLGAYRDQDFCEDDHNDIDLTTFYQFADLMPEVLKRCQKIGFELYHEWSGGDDRTAQLAVIRDGLKIDLMFKKIKEQSRKGEAMVWWTVYQGKEVVYKAVPFMLVTPAAMRDNGDGVDETIVRKIEFYGRKYAIPHETEDYLAYRYGEWKTPVHRSQYSCYSTDKSIVDNYHAI